MSKTYLDGKIKLKEPTLEGLCKTGQLLKTYTESELVAGEGLLALIPIICEMPKDFDFKSNLPPKTATEILKDFFTLWNPWKWISGNTKLLIQSLKSSRGSQTPKDSKKPSNSA